MESPAEVLGVDADADEETVERAYRRRVKDAHPDQGGSLAEFQAVRAAYERLKAADQAGVETVERAEEAGAGDGDEGGTDDGDEDGEWYRRAVSTVAYLDYDVLADFGWSIDDPDLASKARDADLATESYGQFDVEPGETLLEGAERAGFAWPFACRGGACANCAIVIRDGELSMPASHVLPAELLERGVRLSCNGLPITDELFVVYNVKHMPELEELLLPPRPFEQAYPVD